MERNEKNSEVVITPYKEDIIFGEDEKLHPIE